MFLDLDRDQHTCFVCIRECGLILANGDARRFRPGRPGGPPDLGEAAILETRRPIRSQHFRRITEVEYWDPAIGGRAERVELDPSELIPLFTP